MKQLALLLLTALLIFSVDAYSQPDNGKAFQKFLDKLNLTTEQKGDVAKIRFDMEKQTIAQKAKIATARVEMRQILKSDTPEKSDIEKKIKEIAELGVQLHMIKINSWFAVNKLLTVEQQKTWKKVLEMGPALRHRMMDRMRERRMHPEHQPEMNMEK